MSGMGEAVSGGISGDLYIKILVKKDKIWKREGNDLVMTQDVKLTDAILGATYIVSGVDGKIEFQIPKGASTNDILRIKGRGVPYMNNKIQGRCSYKIKYINTKEIVQKVRKLNRRIKREGI